jgi:hypothetical protein
MKSVRFEWTEVSRSSGYPSATGYWCDEPGDMTGPYVPAAVAQALYDAAARAVQELHQGFSGNALLTLLDALAAIDFEEGGGR